jgi:hypothetical protein
MTMNLPYPFQSARDVKPDALGRIALVNAQGVTLAHIPLDTAYDLSRFCEPCPGGCRAALREYGDGYPTGDGSGNPLANLDGDGSGTGYGFGYGLGCDDEDGSGDASASL